MTYSAAPTKATGDLLAASDWNTYVRDNLADHEARIGANSYSGVTVVRTTNQAIPNATNTLVSWTAETIDQGGWFPTTGTTFTVPAGALPAGYTTIMVQVGVSIPFDGNTTGARKVDIYKNAAFLMGTYAGAVDTSTLSVIWASPDIDCVPGDTFSINVAQSSGGSLNLLGATLNLSCSVRRVGYF